MTEQLPILRTDDEETIESLRAELETERMRLAACGVAALGYFTERKDEYRSASLDGTLRLYAEKESLRAENAALKAKLESMMQEGEDVAFVQADPDGHLMLAEITKTEAGQQLDQWDKQMGWKLVPLYTHPLSVAAIEQPIPASLAAELERTDWSSEEALRFYADGKHFDIVSGRTRIIDTGAVASNALKHSSSKYADMKGDVAVLEIEQRTARACAKLLVDVHKHDLSRQITAGEWREYL